MMHRLVSVMCLLMLVTGSVPAFAQPAEDARRTLQGTWTATRAERDGKSANDVIGHRLSVTGNRFQIQSKDGKLLFAGTVRVDPGAKPAVIDFEHTHGTLQVPSRSRPRVGPATSSSPSSAPNPEGGC
jgi:uncharacterized protein (TIGR03067 family)